MDGLPLTNPMFWVSLVLGGIALAAISYGFQMAQDESISKSPLNVKGIIRDVLLGGIFTAMAWTLVPDVMASMTSGVSSVLTTATSVEDVKTGGAGVDASTTSSTSNTMEVQVGPARF
jgi:hypothetical protein